MSTLRVDNITNEAGTDAPEIFFDNTTSGLTATNIKAAIDELSTGSGDAINLDYDNTTSGLTATNVQAAIDEIVVDIGNLQSNAISDGDSNVTVTDNSKISFTFNNVEEGYFNASGLTVTALTETSSLRYKENIKNITSALDTVRLMRGVVYDRRDKSAFGESGLIAEELHKIVPSLVQLDGEGRPDSIHYTRIIAYLIEAIKELEAKIDGKS